MKTLKALLARMFESKWTYSDDDMVRTHKDTGKTQYLWFDDWGHWYESKPMFDFERIE